MTLRTTFALMMMVVGTVGGTGCLYVDRNPGYRAYDNDDNWRERRWERRDDWRERRDYRQQRRWWWYDRDRDHDD